MGEPALWRAGCYSPRQAGLTKPVPVLAIR